MYVFFGGVFEKNLLKRIISLLSVFVILFSLVCVPANADTADDVGDSVGSFAEWLYRLSYPAESVLTWFKGKITSDGDSTAYSDYVTDLQTELGTSTIVNGGLRIYLSATSFSLVNKSGFTSHTGTLWDATWNSSNAGSANTINIWFNSVIAPFAASYDTGYTFGNSFNVAISDNTDSGTCAQGAHVSLDGIDTSCVLVADPVIVSSSEICSVLYGRAYVDFIPITDVLQDYSTADVSADTRAGSLAGDLMYVGDDGTQIAADDVTLFDESTGTVYNPSTNDSYNTTDWNYDYSTRTYNYTTDTGDTGTVSYGDLNASVTLTDSDGNTITYNYYYTVSGTSDSGTTDSSTSIWDKLGDLIGTAIDGLISLVTTALSHLLDSLISLLEMINGKLTTVLDTVFSLFDHIPSLFNGFTAFLAAVFPFIPQEIWDVLELGVFLLAVAVLIRFFLKR